MIDQGASKHIELIKTYGIYPYLIAIKEYEDSNEFEVCAEMIKYAKEYCSKMGISVPDVSKDFKEDYLQLFWRFNSSGERAYKNLPNYVKQIKLKMKGETHCPVCSELIIECEC